VGRLAGFRYREVVRKLASGTKYINPFGDQRSIRKVLVPREILS